MTSKRMTSKILLSILILSLMGCGSSLTSRQSSDEASMLEEEFSEIPAAGAGGGETVDLEMGLEEDFADEDFEDFEDFESSTDVAFEDEGFDDFEDFETSGDEFESFDDFGSDTDLAFEDANPSTDQGDDFSFEDSFDDSFASGNTNDVAQNTTDDFSDADFSFDNISDVPEDMGPDPLDDFASDFSDSNDPMSNSFEDSLDSSFADASQANVDDSFLDEAPVNMFEPNQIKSLEYDSSLRGGSVVVRADRNLEFNTQFDEKASQYIIDIQNTRIPDIYKRPLFMKDFGQDFGAVSSYENADGTARIVIQVKNGLEPNISVEEKGITVSPGSELSSGLALTNSGSGGPRAKVVETSSLEEYLLESTNFTGEPISLQINDEDVTAVINFIADQAGANVVVGEGVKGKVSLKLRDVPWDQALMTIMKSQGLGYIRTGNVLRISRLEDLEKESEAALKIQESQRRLEPIIMKVIPLKYASPEEVEKKIAPLATKDRGSIFSDLRTSSIIINDTITNINKMTVLLKELDTPPPQVLIEAKIVEASRTFAREIGLRWGVLGQPTNLSIDGGSGQPVSIHPSLRVNNIQQNLGMVTAGTDPLSIGLRIGSFDFLGNISALLNLKEEDNEVKIISSPRVVTLNNQEANIIQGTELLRSRTLLIQGQSSQEPIPVPLELNLKVTPQITTDASIMLDVDVKREFPGVVDEASGQSPKNTRQAKTKVLVDNNKTAVIGGIYQNDSQTGVIGVPVLKDIPLFGWLFKTSRKEKIDSELMIFLTPRILDKSYQTSDALIN